MKENKKQHCGKAIFQIVLLVVGTIAFAYIVSNGLEADEYIIIQKKKMRINWKGLYEMALGIAFGDNLVSAAEVTDEDMEGLREQYPDLSDQEINSLLDGLVEGGYITEDDFSNPVFIAGALEQAYADYENALETGEIPDRLGGLIGFIENIIPPIGMPDIPEDENPWNMAGGVATCTLSNDGEVCQEFGGNECDANCAGECFNKPRVELPPDGLGSECSLGLCYDPAEGTCADGWAPQGGATQGACESGGGRWFEHGSSEGEALCQKGCCLFGNQARFITERACENFAEGRGMQMNNGIEWLGDITSEPECQMEANVVEHVACTYDSFEVPDKKDCEFITSEECAEIGGTPNYGMLCSHPDLNTVCAAKDRTGCAETFDEVYWFDSCGNRENIFDANSDSWNGGMILSKEDSCNLGTDDNVIGNQATCGNCNRFFGSRCGNETDAPVTQELNDNPDGGVVCVDMGCYDDNGNRIREHGESWCAYVGSVGMPGPEIQGLDFLTGLIPNNPLTRILGGARATDTPGSLHFKKICEDGEIGYEPCGQLRDQICVEERTEKSTGGMFSTATCRPNRWSECLAYNPDAIEGRLIGMAGKAAKHILKAKLMATCGVDPDCFVKEVKMDEFSFSMCLPRYAPGFAEPQDGKDICSQGSQTCTVVYVTKVSGEKCEKNCECKTPEFARQMNELCTSLGDCGFQVNYVGMPPGGPGYAVGRPVGQGQFTIPSPGQMFGARPYFTDSIAVPGEFIPAMGNEMTGLFGESRQELLGEVEGLEGLIQQWGANRGGVRAPNPVEDIAQDTATLGGITGATGAAAVGFAHLTGTVTVTTTVQFFSGVTASSTSAFLAPTAAVIEGIGGAAAGAGIAMAVTGLLIDWLGIGPGISPAFAYTMIGVAGVAGGVVGFGFTSLAKGAWACIGGGPACVIAIIVIIVIILIIVVLAIFGVGKVRKEKVSFECKPWQRPLVGNCESCGEDLLSDGSSEFPCTQYSCEALGRNCVFEAQSEDFGGGVCVGSGMGDTSAPRLVAVAETISENFEYLDFSGSGFKIRRLDNEGCLNGFEGVTFGFELDEPAYCKVWGTRDAEFENMVAMGGFTKDQEYRFNSLTLEDLGIDSDLELEEVNNIKLFVVCEDVMDNRNDANPFEIDMCVKPDDLMAVSLLDLTGIGWYGHGTVNADFIVYIDEPAECRWDYDEMPYDQMRYEMNCDTASGGDTFGRYMCSGSVPFGEEDVVDICVKCLDHPEWKGTPEEGDRNPNEGCLDVLTFTRSSTEFEITSIIPVNESVITRNVEPAIVELGVTTAGGKDGTASCQYTVDNTGWDYMSETDSTTHRQPMDRLMEGEHLVRVICEDEAGDTDEASTTFSVVIDDGYPRVARVYDSSGTLHLITTEPATCAYVNGPLEGRVVACNFEVSEGTTMTGSGTILHSTSFVKGKTYYIKCKDDLDNERGGCNIVVKSG